MGLCTEHAEECHALPLCSRFCSGGLKSTAPAPVGFINCVGQAFASAYGFLSGPSWRGAVYILSTMPTFDWDLLGSGEFNKGQEIWQPISAACLQDAPCPFWQEKGYIKLILYIAIFKDATLPHVACQPKLGDDVGREQKIPIQAPLITVAPPLSLCCGHHGP